MKKTVTLILASLALSACAHNPARYVEPYGKDTFRVDDGDGVHFANQYCALKGEVMQPLQQGTACINSSVLIFRCVSPAEAQAPNVKPVELQR